MRDSPQESLQPHSVEFSHPDDFLLDALDLAPSVVIELVNAEIAADRPAGRTAGRRPSALRAASAVTTGGYGETAGACRRGQR